MSIQNCQMVPGGKMYDITYGCSCQCRFTKAFYILNGIVASCRIVINQKIDVTGYGKSVVGGRNEIDKGYLGKCLYLKSTAEV